MFNNPILMIDHLYFNVLSEKMNISDKIKIKSEDIEKYMAESNILQKSGSRALISIEGPMVYNPSMFDKLLYGAVSTLDLMDAVQDVAQDNKIKSVVFNVNSGGGEAHKIHVLADMVHALSQQKATATLNSGVMASASYFVGSQTGQIYANDKLNRTGSIGTAVMLKDTAGLFEQNGVKVIPVTTGPLKAMPADGVEISEDIIAYVQEIVDEMQQGFSDAVIRVRSNADMEDGSEARSGKTFSFDKASELGLIDGIKELDEIYAMLEAKSKYNNLRKS